MAADERIQTPSSAMRRYTVGYALATKKRKSFIQPSLISAAAVRGIDLVPIDPTLPLTSQGPFDLVLQKLSGDDWHSNLASFSATYPSIPVVDRPSAISRLRNRISMLQVVSEIDASSFADSDSNTFGIPSQVVVYSPEELADSSSVSALRLPVIAKPLVSDGSAKSHKMSLVFERSALLNLRPPLVLQEFVNHGGVIFKVYVVGDSVTCVKRRSLPDVPLDSAAPQQGCMSFSQISNVGASGSGGAPITDAELPPTAFLTNIAHGLRDALGLSLFNFDMIRDIEVGNRYYIIDINYFPGYAKMPSYEAVLSNFFWEVLRKEETKTYASVATDAGNEEETGSLN